MQTFTLQSRKSMNTASRWMIAFALFFAATSGTLDLPRAQAQDVEITGPLAGAPAVRRMRIYRDGRFQLQPVFGFTLNDEFARTMLAGVQIGYHFTDWLGLHGFFQYGLFSLDTGLTDQVGDRGQTTERNRLSLPRPGKFSDQIGRLVFLSGVQATFIPLRGKLSLFQALFVDTDFYLFGGAAFAQVEERADVTTGICVLGATDFNVDACNRSQTARATRIQVAPTFGAGLSMYVTDFMGITLEYRAFPFKWNNSGTDEGGTNASRDADKNGEFPDGRIDDADRFFHFNQMFTLGLAFYLPFHSEVTK
jgi:outer membrane beta-barrel protein